MNDLNQLFNCITSIRKLERDKSIDYINKLFDTTDTTTNGSGNGELINEIELKLIGSLDKSIGIDNITWEFKYVVGEYWWRF